jgi:hypothetical protein
VNSKKVQGRCTSWTRGLQGGAAGFLAGYDRLSSTLLTISRHRRSAASAGAWSRSSSGISGATFLPTITEAGLAAGSPGAAGDGEGAGSRCPTMTLVIFGPGFGFLIRFGGRAMTIPGLSVSIVAMSGRTPAMRREGGSVRNAITLGEVA